MARVDLRGVRKRYGDVEAVREVSLTLEDGEFFAILGPSGCGKSSLLRMVGGLEEVSEGEILVDGEPVQDTEPRERNMAMVFEAFALYPHLSVRDNVRFPLRVRGEPREEIDRRVRWALELVGLDALADRGVRQLSEGQKQRTSLARAIVREPVVFLLDEPVSHVEAGLRAHLRAEIMTLHRELGVTTMYVTHDQSEALSMGDRLAVMTDGRFLQVGPPEEIYERPATITVARFVGEPPMNLLDGELVEDGGTVTFRTDGASVPVEPEPGWVLRRRAGPAVLGIRPEDVEVAAPGMPGIPATVSVVESQGDVAFLYAEGPSGLLQVEVAPDVGLRDAERVTLAAAEGALHLFDPADGASMIVRGSDA